jgi:ankyrin repeat protein
MNVNAANDTGMTPLHCAAHRGSDRIAPPRTSRGKTAALITKPAGAATQQ